MPKSFYINIETIIELISIVRCNLTRHSKTITVTLNTSSCTKIRKEYVYQIYNTYILNTTQATFNIFEIQIHKIYFIQYYSPTHLRLYRGKLIKSNL